MTFDPYSLDQDRILRLRGAAQASWRDDTRPEAHRGHKDPSVGQSYVTSRWLQSLLGGHVGQKQGYHFWVSPDKRYALDLTGERHRQIPEDWSRYQGLPMDADDEGGFDARRLAQHIPGHPIYKKTNHPLFKNFKISDDTLAPSEVRVFSDRANKAYES